MSISMTIVNPYDGVYALYTAGMDAVANDLEPIFPAQTITDLNDSVYTYILATFYSATSDPFLIREIRSIVPFSINGYINSAYGGTMSQYNATQQQIIYQMLEGIKNVPIESIYTYLQNIEYNIPKSGLSVREQSPLFLAVLIGKASYEYWLAKFVTPGDWADFLSGTTSTDRTMLPDWVAASIEGTLLGGGMASSYGLIDPPRIAGIDLVSALTSAIGIAAGKVIFKWIKEVNDKPIKRPIHSMSAVSAGTKPPVSVPVACANGMSLDYPGSVGEANAWCDSVNKIHGWGCQVVVG